MKLVWLQSGGCGGCTLSWLGSEWGSLFATLADAGLSLDMDTPEDYQRLQATI